MPQNGTPNWPNPATTGMVLQRASPGNGAPKTFGYVWMINFLTQHIGSFDSKLNFWRSHMGHTTLKRRGSQVRSSLLTEEPNL